MHVLALAIWLGTVAMTAVAAAVIFPQLKALAPTLAGYAGYTGDHWMIAAGHVANRIFVIGDVIQAVCAGVAGLTIAVALMARRFSPFRAAAAVRLLAMLVAFGAMSYQFGSLRPDMRRNLDEYWLAAEQGRNEDAAVYQERFRALHPAASNTLAVAGGAVLVSLLAAVWSLSAPWRPGTLERMAPEYGDE